MKGLPFVLAFTAMTFLAWGSYGPLLHNGALALEHDSMRAFVGVGLAYFLIAVIFPLLILSKGGEVGRWTVTGAIASLIAGAVGAIGALGIILALGYGGKTVYVMPLVFGFAPVVNTLVTAALSKTFKQISPIFIGGIIAAACGASGVLAFKPAAAPAASEHMTAPDSTSTSATMESESGNDATLDNLTDVGDTKKDSDGLPDEAAPNASDDSQTTTDENTDEQANAEIDSSPQAEEPVDVAPVDDHKDVEHSDELASADSHDASEESSINVLGIIVSICVAALCWGSYGPMLHIGQAKMQGSRMRPFACVGLAYFVIAVAVPLVLISSRANDVGVWTGSGMLWSFLAGVAGAIGALGVLLAFNAGGKPYYVMPLIFGFAPVINTFISLTEADTWGLVKLPFWLSLAVVIGGAITVLTNAPKPAKPSSQPKPVDEGDPAQQGDTASKRRI